MRSRNAERAAEFVNVTTVPNACPNAGTMVLEQVVAVVRGVEPRNPALPEEAV